MIVNITRKTVLKSVIVILLMVGAGFFGATQTVPKAYQQGKLEGYLLALKDINAYLRSHNITQIEFKWEAMPDGYKISAVTFGEVFARGYVTVHLNIQHYRNGMLLADEWGAGVLTNFGKDWIEQQLSGTINSSQHALYLSDSNDATDPPLAAWNVLPSEITTNGLDRQTGTYTSTGTGTWNVTVTKTATGTQSTQLWGINADSTDGSQYLVAADSGPAQKNLVTNDTLKETWQISVS